MYGKVLEIIRKFNMINNGDNIVVGFSGGADSTCLVWLLNKLKDEIPFKLYAIHVHHGLRGEEADRDAKFAENFCADLGVECQIIYRDISNEAKKLKISEEEAGRKARYDIFDQKIAELKGGKIAVAHHMNDQAETILFNIIRGSGLKGIGGMRPVRDNIIRPLIECSRQEIENYCINNSIEYMKDHTNELEQYTRNKIRLNLIPYIEENFNPSFIKQLTKMAELIREDEAYIQKSVEEEYQRIVIKKTHDKFLLDIELLLSTHPTIRNRIYRKVITDLGIGLKDIESKHIRMIDKLLYGDTGKCFDLPNRLYIEKVYQQLSMSTVKPIKIEWEYDISNINEKLYIKEMGIHVKLSKFYNNNYINFPKKIYTKWFDYDRIIYNLSIRNRRQGDFIYLKGVNGKKKLKDFFVDSKIPRNERDRVPLLADGQNIIWAVGYRMNENYKVTEHTKNILEVQFKEEGNKWV